MLTKRDEYIRQLHECSAHAAVAATTEISALWETIAGSYRFLIEREDRVVRQLKQDSIRLYDPLL